MTARLSPPDRRALGAANWLLWRALSRAAGVPDAHLFGALGRTGKLFRSWLRFAGALMPGGSLPRREAELVILRVASLRGCDYELDHHRRLGERAGLSPAEIDAAVAGSNAAAWSDRERALLAGVDELVRARDLDDASWHELRRHYTEPELVELCLLVGHYELLATTIAALRIERDF